MLSVIKNNAEIVVGDRLQSINEHKPRLHVVGMGDDYILLRWIDDISKIKHGCQSLTQEFKLSHEEFLKTLWVKA